MPNINDVKCFWDRAPLFAGEGSCESGTKEWFLEHENIIETDCFSDSRQFEFIIGRWIAAHAHVLDVGCGPGYWVRRFLRCGYSYVSACDLALRAVELTKKVFKYLVLQPAGKLSRAMLNHCPLLTPALIT